MAKKYEDAEKCECMHVHDEMIVDVPLEDWAALQRINRAMSDPIPWAPGLPLKGDGYECDFYKKD